MAPSSRSAKPGPAPTPLPVAEAGADILALNDRVTETVAVPEWGRAVIVQSLTGDERDAMEAWVAAHRSDDGKVDVRGYRAFLVTISAVNSAGELLFSATDAAALGRKHGAAINRLATAALKLSKVSEADIEEAAEQLGKGQSAASGSG